jgi:trimethylamine--corrinoid protein Co-methyltransferase
MEVTSIICRVGATDAGSTASYTRVFDNEIIGGLQHMLARIDLHDFEEEVALIKNNTPRGNLLKENHTRSHHLQHWRPEILSRVAFEAWQEKGETIEQICRRKAVDILDHHELPRLPASVEVEIERILRQYLGANFSLE